MDALLIQGPAKLKGTVEISGSKNTALPLLFASLLFEKETEFHNIPRLWDIETTLKILSLMGCETSWNKEDGVVKILPTVKDKTAPYEWVRRMRAGILALGPLVAKYGEAKVSLPGGCAIGARPVNFHIDALRKLGVTIDVEEGYIHAKVKNRLKGAEITFPEITVTGTENLLMVAAFADGETILKNSASEPEVVAVGELLQEAGIRIDGLGTSTIHIHGGKMQERTKPVIIPPDRIETGTWIAASAATRSPLLLKRTDARALTSVIATYRDLGVGIRLNEDGTEIRVEPGDTYYPLEIDTQPYPGFPTDMQAQLLVNLCQAKGKSRIRETIFENRFMHVAELQRLGAKIEIKGNAAIVEGPTEFNGAPLMATDLRASASLVLAALAAKGTTRVNRIYHLDRGYQRLDEKLRLLGASIERVAE
jgi:UDP-N-acetylglucosamine 1-carboxyvinyltransferase